MPSKKYNFFLSTYKMGKVSVINIHENDDVNKTNLKLLCISDV